jgi:hypothetical protein
MECHFDHGERLDVDLRKPLLQARDQIEEILERQIGMKAADDVEFRNSLGIPLCGRGPGLFQSHGVGALGTLLASEGTQAA